MARTSSRDSILPNLRGGSLPRVLGGAIASSSLRCSAGSSDAAATEEERDSAAGVAGVAGIGLAAAGAGLVSVVAAAAAAPAPGEGAEEGRTATTGVLVGVDGLAPNLEARRDLAAANDDLTGAT